MLEVALDTSILKTSCEINLQRYHKHWKFVVAKHPIYMQEISIHDVIAVQNPFESPK